MNVEADARFASRADSRLLAAAMALGVHAAFVLLLVFGVSWQTQQAAPVMVDLWSSLPQPAAPIPQPTPEPAKLRPEPVKPAPAPAPKAEEPPPPKAPDIALEKKRAEAERLKKQQAIEAERLEKERAAEAARARQLAEQKKREQAQQREAEAMMQRLADEAAASEAKSMQQQAAARAAASARQAEASRVVGQYRDLISAKVRGNTRLPDNLQGNPEVRCLVKLLPTGEVQSVRVTRSSGNAAYDEAVVRAIEKSSPLPLPPDRDARAAFVPELSFVHRPKD